MATETPDSALTARQILNETGAPVVVFDHVQLAFDEKVVLKDISFTLIKGHTKIILGASGSGKSTVLKIVVGLLRADAGVVWVNTFDAGDITAPFGGFKQSGFGRDKSMHSLEKFTDLKTIWIQL